MAAETAELSSATSSASTAPPASVPTPAPPPPPPPPPARPKRHRRARTPTVLQMEAVECGAAALGSMLGYFGRFVPLAELRRECGVTRDGSQASNVLKAAARYGLVARGFRKSLDALEAMKPPNVVFWNFSHFLIVEGFDAEKVYLNDPATGPREVTRQDFSGSYTGVVLTFEPGPNFTKGGAPAKVLPALKDRLAGSAAAVFFAVTAGLLLVLPGLTSAALTQIFVDQVLVRRVDGWLVPLVLGLVLVGVFQIVLVRLRLGALRRLRLKLATVMASRFLWQVLRLPASFYAQRYAGEIGNRVAINDRVAGVLTGRLATTAIDVTVMALYAVAMASYDIGLAALAIGAAAISLFVLQAVARSRIDANLRLMQVRGKAAGYAIAGLQGLETIKASAIESDFFARWAGYFAQSTSAQQSLGLSGQVLGTLPTVLAGVTTSIVLVIGGLRVVDGSFSVGMLMAFLGLMSTFLAPVTSLVGLGSTFQELRADLDRLDDVLRNAPVTRETAGDASGPATSLDGSVELKDVSFGYNKLGPPILDAISIAMVPGSRVGLVGGSGSGKSTLIRILCGLYQPWGGEVLFDGVPLGSLPPGVFSMSVSLVEQDAQLFSATVRDNLTLWDSSVPHEALRRACEDACIHDVIASLPGGYDAALAEGASNLSGGERQRLEIARALVTDPRVLLLDEATSALDAETEREIGFNLRRRGCTTVLVAHRLSTVRDCDEIVVLRQGRIVERGTHDELVALGQEYARLVATEDLEA